MKTQQRIDQLKGEARCAGLLAPSGPWLLEGDKSWSDMVRVWEGPKGADFAAQDLPLVLKYMPDIRPMRILEVGGGYGKLARMILEVVAGPVEYTMVDAVPESLAHAEENMAVYPNVRVVPAWGFVPGEYDMCINIASMQEMSQEQVDYWIKLFGGHTVVGGVIFLMNSRDYHGRTFAYPQRWVLLHKAPMHRSLTPDYPCEVFARVAYDVVGVNERLELEYLASTVRRYCGIWQDCNRMRQERNVAVLERNALRARALRRSLGWWLTSPLRALRLL